jgi:hypothetical protein
MKLGARVFVATERVDGLKGIDGLSALLRIRLRDAAGEPGAGSENQR